MLGEVIGIRRVGMRSHTGEQLMAVEVMVTAGDLEAEQLKLAAGVQISEVVLPSGWQEQAAD